MDQVTVTLSGALFHGVYPCYLDAKQKHLGYKKKCEANQKQHARRQVRPKALISAEAKKLATLSKNF